MLRHRVPAALVLVTSIAIGSTGSVIAADACSSQARLNVFGEKKQLTDLLSTTGDWVGIVPTAPGSRAESLQGNVGDGLQALHGLIKACDVLSAFMECKEEGRTDCVGAGAENSLCAAGEVFGLDGSNPFSLLTAVPGVTAPAQAVAPVSYLTGQLFPSFNPLCSESYEELWEGTLACCSCEDAYGGDGGCVTPIHPEGLTVPNHPCCQGRGYQGPAMRTSASPNGQTCEPYAVCFDRPGQARSAEVNRLKLLDAFEVLRGAYLHAMGQAAAGPRRGAAGCDLLDLWDLGSFRGCTGFVEVANGAAPYTKMRDWIPEPPRSARRQRPDAAYVDQLATNAALRLLLSIPSSADRFGLWDSYSRARAHEIPAILEDAGVERPDEVLRSWLSPCALAVVKTLPRYELLALPVASDASPGPVDACSAGSAPRIESLIADSASSPNVVRLRVAVANPDRDPLYLAIDWGDGTRELRAPLAPSGESSHEHEYPPVVIDPSARRGSPPIRTIKVWAMDHAGLVGGRETTFAIVGGGG